MNRTFEALYYPFIHFRDEAWVKTMSLYWDGVSRIVPAGYPTRDAADIQGLQDVGFITNIDPSQRVRTKAARAFRVAVDSRRTDMEERFNLDRLHEWPPDRQLQGWVHTETYPQLAYIHTSKVERSLVTDLVSANLACFEFHRDAEWLGMHPRLADAYMVALADVLAVELAAHPLTEDLRAHCAVATGLKPDADLIASAVLGDEPPQRGPRDAEEVLVAIAFDTVLPELRDVPIDVILEVRRKTAEERFSFQEGISALTQPIDMEGASGEALSREMLRIYESQVAPSLLRIEKAFQSSGIRSIKQMLSVKTSLTGLGGLVSSPITDAQGPLIAGALALMIGVHDVASARKGALETVRSASPVAAYLTRLKRELPGAAAVEKVLV